ncbi:FxsA family protein [Mangrovibacillus cuniculi]|uniref:Membrane protein FxsA n=1 Tax=Mangrovibacillus cuniculi TaxID=2593652 RepID=A0A7S8CC22_9BACI|nr:FxsA family protein [Mangrovibacillus cuniculi]QPC47206.1 membrane protein FxsA [Mangrovibacillus cuniculi]
MRYLLPFLIIIPALEIWVLLLAGTNIGVMNTILLIIATGVLGAYLAKQQGKKTWIALQQSIASGQQPADYIVDGLCVLVGGVLLLTPGFITDFIGFYLLLPVTRKTLKKPIYTFFRNRMQNGNTIIINGNKRW